LDHGARRDKGGKCGRNGVAGPRQPCFTVIDLPERATGDVRQIEREVETWFRVAEDVTVDVQRWFTLRRLIRA
jgi:hypothetical protein